MRIITDFHRSRYCIGMFFLTAAMAGLSLLSGCINSARVVVGENVSFEKYKQVYLIPPEKDTHDITSKVAARLEAMNFKVRIVDPNRPSDAQGSGFVITDKGHILTVGHLFGKENLATVWIKGKRFEADVVKQDEKKDLALLKIRDANGVPLAPVELAFDANVKMWQDIYTIGFPLSTMLGNTPRLNKGLISSAVGLKDDPNTLQISAEIQSGNSGSPLFDKDGKVIGVVSQTLNPMSVLVKTGGNLPQNVNFAIKIQIVKEFLDSCGLQKQDYLTESPSRSFDQAQDSVAKICSGIVTDEELTQPKMVCHFEYVSFWDFGDRLKFDIVFWDAETSKALLRAGQYYEDPYASEETTLDNVFKRIREKMYPQTAKKKN